MPLRVVIFSRRSDSFADTYKRNDLVEVEDSESRTKQVNELFSTLCAAHFILASFLEVDCVQQRRNEGFNGDNQCVTGAWDEGSHKPL